MILKSLYLKVGDLGLPTEFTYGFLKRSRSLCNYLEREVLRAIRFQAQGFSRIVISASSEPKDAALINSAKVACLDVAWDKSEYETLSGDSLTQYYVRILEQGMDKAAACLTIPKAELQDGIQAFFAGGSKNRWIHSNKLFKELGVRVALECELSQEEFTLTLQASRGEERLLESVILRTDPDEIAFEHRFKEVKIRDGELVVLGKLGERHWGMNLSSISR